MSLVAGVRGTLTARTADAALVDIGGVTLQVFVPAHDLAQLPAAGEPVSLVTSLIVREDDLALYGFISEQGRRLFESLLSVSQVGPKAALAILSVLAPDQLAGAIVAGDAKSISRAPGVGPRTAERIIVDLRSKMEEEFGAPLVQAAASAGAATAAAGTGADPALQWLTGLGFSALEARQALSVEHEEGLDTDERVRRALQRMGQGPA